MVVVMLAAIGYVSQKRSFLPSWTPAVIIQDETVLYGKNNKSTYCEIPEHEKAMSNRRHQERFN